MTYIKIKGYNKPLSVGQEVFIEYLQADFNSWLLL